jgi:hypothetical protein
MSAHACTADRHAQQLAARGEAGERREMAASGVGLGWSGFYLKLLLIEMLICFQVDRFRGNPKGPGVT